MAQSLRPSSNIDRRWGRVVGTASFVFPAGVESTHPSMGASSTEWVGGGGARVEMRLWPRACLWPKVWLQMSHLCPVCRFELPTDDSRRDAARPWGKPSRGTQDPHFESQSSASVSHRVLRIISCVRCVVSGAHAVCMDVRSFLGGVCGHACAGVGRELTKQRGVCSAQCRQAAELRPPSLRRCGTNHRQRR